MDIQLKRGLLDVSVLAAIKSEDSYGYKIIKDMKPYLELSESTLYTILKRLESAEMLTVKTAEHNGRLRKYYHITAAGLQRIEEFKEEEGLVSIRAEIFCEKESHKGIIVGKKGAGLKLVGTYARQDLEKLFGTKVYLNLWVKVKENWRESAKTVGNFGYRDEE